ncbi:MAG: hypothetical protein IKM80_05015 [Bacilli bacterium]|nr:hypothetical protein [Bacilli bacterium]
MDLVFDKEKIEAASWPGVRKEDIKFKAWIDYRDIKPGMRIIDAFMLDSGDDDYIDLPGVVTNVEYGDFSDAEFIFHCRYICQLLKYDGTVLEEQTTTTGRDEDIENGDVGVFAYFKSEEEVASFGLKPSNLEPADL